MEEIRMAHPAKNALGTDLLTWLSGELDRVGGEPFLLTGTDGAFCAGLNLKEVAASDAAGMERMLRLLDEVVQRIYEHPAPTVALVNGHAIAGGCVLVQCCDHRVAVDHPKVRVGLNEVALGACFPPGLMNMLRHRLPSERIDEILLGAALYDTAGALERGMLDVVTEDAEGVARAWLETTSAHPRETYALTKVVLRGGVATATEEEDRRFVEDELALWTSEDVKKRVMAVLGR